MNTIATRTLKINTTDVNLSLGTPRPSWVIAYSSEDYLDINSVEINNGIRYLFDDEQFSVNDTKAATYRKHIRSVSTMQGVEASSNILLDFRPHENELLIHELCVYRQKEKVDKLSTADIQPLRREYKAERGIFSGDLTISILLDDIKINDVIVLEYSVVSRNALAVQYFDKFLPLESGLSLYKLHEMMRVPNNKTIQYKFYNSDAELKKQEDGGYVVYSYSKENIPVLKANNLLPRWYLPCSYLQIGLKKPGMILLALMKNFMRPRRLLSHDCFSL